VPRTARFPIPVYLFTTYLNGIRRKDLDGSLNMLEMLCNFVRARRRSYELRYNSWNPWRPPAIRIRAPSGEQADGQADPPQGGGQVMGFNALLLTTVGRKTGTERTTPVGWFPGKDGSWLIVASANGAAGNPA